MQQRKSKRWLPLTLVLIVVGTAVWWLLGRNNNKGEDGAMRHNALHEAKQKAVKMTMQVASMSITEIRNDRIQVANRVIVNNPLPVALNASRLDYTVMAGKEKVASGSYTRPIHIPAGSDTVLTLPLEVLVPAMDRVNNAASAAGRDSVAYTFYNTIHTDIPIAGETKIPFNVVTTLPVVWVPVMDPGDLDLGKFGLKESSADMVMRVRNPNSFTIRMLNGRYTMTIDGKHTMNGRMEQVVELPPKQTTPVTMHMDMQTGRALKMGWKMLFDKKDTRYKLNFDSEIASDRKLLEDSRMHFEDEGTLHDLIKEVRKKVE